MQPGAIGRYEIHTLLGEGGMGKVYQARDPLMERWVAIKMLTIQDAYQRARFLQEVRAAGKLNHPHIITIYNVETEGELAYIVMELVEGGTLANLLVSPVGWTETAGLLLPICEALAYAHRQGVIHRDVKPANILLSAEGQVKLTDFGVARLEVAQRLTTSGNTVGTPLYTAPEQIRNEKIDGRVDLFSLGIVLFELITGRHPFGGETLAQVVYRLAQPEPVNLKPLVGLAPPSLIEVIGRALSKDPSDRFPDAEAMTSALSVCLKQSTGISSPPLVLPTSPPRLEYVASDLTLAPAEEALLQSAFAGHDRLYLEREFKRGFSGARVLLATPVRSGRRLTKVVLKLDTTPAIDQEWQAYRGFVADILPPTTARITQPPVYAAEGTQALLWYTFAGEMGPAAPESLRSYYAHQSGQVVADLLERGIFQTFGRQWWQQRATESFILRREYDRLLPVHLVLQPHPRSAETPRLLIAGEVNTRHCRVLERGQVIELKDFVVAELELAQGEVTLQALPPSGNPTNPIRVRVAGLDPGQFTYQVDDRIPSFSGRVVATRHDLLLQVAQPAFLNQDLNQKRLIIGKQAYPNPLLDYEVLLDYLLFTMTSTIHGDLNLENILVTPDRNLAWLIDFAATRQGHALADFIRLETQVLTKLLPQTEVGPAQVVRLMQLLHHHEPFSRPLPAKLKKPFVVLVAIRRMVKTCLYNSQSWDEYYLGLVITLLGALKFKELDTRARRIALAAAAAARGLIEAPELQLTEEFPVPRQSRRRELLIGVVGAILLTILGGLLFFSGQRSASTGSEVPTPSLVVALEAVTGAISTPSAAPTERPAATPSSTPSPSQTPVSRSRRTAVVVGPLDIYSGPGLEYPIIDTVPEGNSVQVTGRSAGGRWWQIAHPSGPGGFGWILAEFIDLRGTFVPPIALASPPPTATNTPSPSPTPSPTSTATPTPTPKPRPTPTPTPPPNPDTGFRPILIFEQAWNTLDQGQGLLGYPLGPAIADRNYARQYFEQGFMFWWEALQAPRPIWVIYMPDPAANQGDSWEEHQDLWDGSQPEYPVACPEAGPPLGPKSGFGLTWCNNARVKEALGRPLNSEFGSGNIHAKGAVQFFQGGVIFESPQDRQIWALIDDGGWYRFNY